MNKVVLLHDKGEIYSVLRKDVKRNIYCLGDLDDFFWEHTTWFALKGGGRIKSLAMLYTGGPVPALLAFCNAKTRPWALELLVSSAGFFPKSFYAHLTPGLAGALRRQYTLTSHGPHYKMVLSDARRALAADTSGTVALTRRDLPALLKFYAHSYPGNWFEPRMLSTGMYFGIKTARGIAAAAGVHVYSEKYKVAALGNVTTLPAMRGKGFGRKVTARVCRELLKRTDLVGLNVKADNAAAIACYKGLGFEITAPYEEYSAAARPPVR